MVKKFEIGKYIILPAMILSLNVGSVSALSQPKYVTDVNTSNANLTLEGNNKVFPNNDFSLNIVLDDIKGSNLMGIQGNVNVLDDTCISLISLEGQNGVMANKNIFAYTDFNGFNSKTILVKANFKALQNTCSTTISVDNIKMSFTDHTKIKYEDSASMLVNIEEKEEIPVIEEVKQEKVKNIDDKIVVSNKKIVKEEISQEITEENNKEIDKKIVITYKDNFKKFINTYFN